MGLLARSFCETLKTAVTSGAAITAAAATSMLPTDALYTLPADYWELGRQLEIKAAGKLSTVITTPGTFRFDVRFGATVVFDGLAVLPDTAAAHTNVGWILNIFLTCVSVGSAAATTLMGHGTLVCEAVKGQGTAMPVGGVVANLPWNSTPAAGNGFSSKASQQVDLFFTQTVATGSITLQQYALISPN